MSAKDYNEILDLISETTIDLQNFKVNEPIAQIENTPVFVPGTLSLVTSTHPAATSRFLAMVAAAAATGSAPSITSRHATLHVIDSVSSAPTVGTWRSTVKSLCSGSFPSSVTLSSVGRCQPADVARLAETIIRERRPDILILNNITSMIKSESYAEIRKTLQSLTSIASSLDVHIVIVAQPGFKLSLKRPGRLASLYLQSCASVFNLTHDLDNHSFTITLHDVDTMTTLEVTHPLNLTEHLTTTPSAPTLPEVTNPSVLSEEPAPIDISPETTSDAHHNKGRRLNSRQRRRLLALAGRP